MTNRRQVLIAFAVSSAVPFAALAQQSQKIYRVGFLFSGTLATRPQAQAFWRGLSELGYIEGKNVAIEIREGKGQNAKMPELAAELVSWKPDVIVAVTTTAALAAQQASRSIPIVFAVVSDPIGSGLVKSLARPEANITGVSNNLDLLGPKQLQLLKEVLPKTYRVGLLWNARSQQNVQMVKKLEGTAPGLGMELRSFPIREPNEVPAVLASAARESPHAIFVLADQITFDHRRAIISAASTAGIPTIHTWPEEAADGGLVAYGPSLVDQYHRAASYVDKILKGVKTSNLPVEAPNRYELVVNAKTAKALGIAIPQSILLRADKVID